MQLLPPELTPYNPTKYYSDLEYREEVDLEKIGERRLRLALLFNPTASYEIEL